MIEHIVLFRFKSETSALTKQKIATELMALKGKVPSILDISAGPNFADRNQGYEYGLVVRFADRQGLESYQVHPDHQKIVHELIRPELADILAVDYEFPQAR
jgi:hypothetical protein